MGIRSVLDIFRPAPNVEEIRDREVVKRSYRYWRLRIFYSMYIGYIFYYFTRKSFTFAAPLLIQDLGFDKGQLGLLGTILYITYGASKFISGVMADRANPRFFMAFGLILTGLLNILFGLSSSLVWFAIFWALNGWFQGWGWPPCARLLTHWYSQSERGTWWGIWNTSHNIGGALIALTVGVIANALGWRWAMHVPGLLCITGGLFLINRLRDTPQSLGLPPVEKFRNDATEKVTAEEVELSAKEILFTYVLKNKYIWLLGISYFFVYIIRTAINDWTNLFLVETKGYSVLTANACVSWFEIGGIVGSLVAGIASDRLFAGRRGPINLLFSLAVTGAIAALWLAPPLPVVHSALIFLIGFLIFGPQMLIGMAAAEISHKKAAGSATGFVGWLAYLGGAVSGYPLMKLTHELGWHGFFVTLGACGFLAIALLCPLWNVKSSAQMAAAATAASSEEPLTEPLHSKDNPSV